MTAPKPRPKFTAGELLFGVFCAWIVIGALAQWMGFYKPAGPREGDSCGPAHVWKNMGGPDYLYDLSCEKE